MPSSPSLRCSQVFRLIGHILETGTWEQRKLGDLGEAYTGLTGKTKEDFKHGTAKFVTYMNVYSNTISEIGELERIGVDPRQNEVRYGDVFFTVSSETPQEVAMSSVWLFNVQNVYLNSFCFGYRFKDEPGSYYYWGYYIRSPRLRHHFSILAQGISRYNISKNRILATVVDIPRNYEQKKIGLLFCKIDNLIAANEQVLKLVIKIVKNSLTKSLLFN